MRFNVVIPTHGRAELLARTLESLAHADRPEGFESVIVVENGSDSGARQICEDFIKAGEFPLRYFNRVEPGKSRALQWVLENLGDGFVLFLDDDVRVAGDIFVEYAAAAARRGQACFFGGPLKVDYAAAEPPQWLKKYQPASVVGWEPNNPDRPVEGYRFLGANYGVFVEQVLRVGGFDSRLGPGANVAGTEGNPTGTEWDLQDRLLAAGLAAVYVPGAVVWHYVPEERCSADWTLHRVYRAKLKKGLLSDTPAGPSVFGAPWRLWLSLGKGHLRKLAALFLSDVKRKFELELHLYSTRGLIKGFQLKQNTKGIGALPGPRKQAAPSVPET